MPLVLPAPPPHPQQDKVDAGPVAAGLGQLSIQLPSPDPLQIPIPNASSHQKGTKSPDTPAAPPRASPAQPTSAAQSGAGRGPAQSCHISVLSQELYHTLVAHASLHREIKQVGGGTAARCHRALPHAGSRRTAGPPASPHPPRGWSRREGLRGVRTLPTAPE